MEGDKEERVGVGKVLDSSAVPRMDLPGGWLPSEEFLCIARMGLLKYPCRTQE